jgi:4-amino-4-deoxy-L-arabinose transferase-like glycosyltransferase
LYPLVLTPCVALGPFSTLAIAILHVALGLATVWLVYRLGRRWGLGNYALLAAALVACDPILLVQSIQVMTETPATFLAVASLVFVSSASERPSTWRAMLAGGCLALATLCRATFLPLMILAALGLPMFTHAWKERLRVFGSFAAAAALVLGPWAVRNQIHFGRPIIATTHGGYTLLLGNNPSFYRYLRTGAWGTVWDADEFNRTWRAQATRTRPADELRNDGLAYAQAWQTIRRQPGTFVYSCLVRAGRLWAPLPHGVDPHEPPAKRGLRYLVGLWYLVELALAAIGLVALSRRARRDETWRATWLWGILLAACFTAVHALYWSNLRMRAPLVPVVALAASAGTAWIAACLLGRKSLFGKSLRP